MSLKENEIFEESKLEAEQEDKLILQKNFKRMYEKYTCIYCDCIWGENHDDGTKRTYEEHLLGEICPECNHIQKELIIDKD